MIDNDFGRRVQYPTGPIGNPMTPKIAALDDVESVWAWRQLLGYLRGSWRSFYLPTFQKDLPVVTSLDLGSTSFQVEFVAAARYIGTNTPRRDILIRLADGRQYVRRITSVADNGDGTETVQLATAPEGAAEVIQAADVMVSYATLVRIEGDAATFEHERPGAASLRFVTTGVKN